VSAHFGSAPLFLIVEAESGACRPIPNRTHAHAHGMCQPLASLEGERIEGVVVGGIGMGALFKLQAAHIRVFRSEHATVADTVAAFTAGTLREVTPATACGHHHGHGPHGGGPHGPACS